MSEDLKQFNIELDDIKESEDLFSNIREAIRKMQIETMKDRFEVVLNNNLIECKEKLTNYRTILGCRVSYQDLEESISFIVREDNKPTYEELESKNKDLEERIEKAIEYIKENKNKRYASYGDNEDDDFEVMLDDEEIDELLGYMCVKDNDCDVDCIVESLQSEVEILDKEDEFIDIEEPKNILCNTGKLEDAEDRIAYLSYQVTTLIKNQKLIIEKIKEK